MKQKLKMTRFFHSCVRWTDMISQTDATVFNGHSAGKALLKPDNRSKDFKELLASLDSEAIESIHPSTNQKTPFLLKVIDRRFYADAQMNVVNCPPT